MRGPPLIAPLTVSRRLAAAWALTLLAGCGGAGSIVGAGLVKQALAASGDESGTFAVASPSGTIEIPFRLMKPDGDGPYPAVVMLHDCSGLGRRSSGAPLRWARKLVPQGFVVIIPDSFTPRGLADGVCTNGEARGASPFVRAGDAGAALAYLRRQPYVADRPVAVMGGSHGGSTTLATVVERDGNAGGFAAAIALYPGCGVNYGDWHASRSAGRTGPTVAFTGTYKPTAPLLILIGENDDWTPAAYCRSLAEAAQHAGYPVALKVYPGALHSFDSNSKVKYNPERINRNKPDGRGATTGGDPVAWADAEKEVSAFLARYLAGTD
jgi:dienelactone hydrolase